MPPLLIAFTQSTHRMGSRLPILHCNGVETAKAYFVCISVWSSEAHSLTISHRFTPATGSLSRNDKLLFFLIADFRSFFLRHMLIKLF